MPPQLPLSPEQMQTLAQVARLNISPEIAEALAKNVSELMERFEQVWAIDTGELEPPTISFDREEPA